VLWVLDAVHSISALGGLQGSENDDPLRRLGPVTSHRSSNLKNDQFVSDAPSIGRRISRTLARFLFVLLLGVGITLAWQSFREEAKEVVRTWVPSLGWVLPPTVKWQLRLKPLLS
jgi:hypothetical protein